MREVTVIPRKPRVGNTATKIEVKKLRVAACSIHLFLYVLFNAYI